MKKITVFLIFVLITFLGCDIAPKDVPVQNISINVEDVLFIGQQAYINVEFSPLDTTERNLTYFSSDENILTINNSGTITPKSKGKATITVKCQNGNEVTKIVAVYQIVNKPTIINTSEQWGPFEKILGNGNSYNASGEIGINSGVEVKINNNTIVENARLVIAGKLFTEDCEKENTIFSQVRIEGNGEYYLDNITIDRLYSDTFRKGIIVNSIFIKPPRDYDFALQVWWGALELIDNIFMGDIDFITFSGTYVLEYNQLFSTIYFSSASSTTDSVIFRYNTINMNEASISIRNSSNTPNINLSNNYWGTTDTTLIDNFITDRNDSLSISYFVNYLPILLEKPELSKFTVTFETGGGSPVQSITNISKGSKINKPNDPIRENYQFLGWFIDSNLEIEWDFLNDTVETNIKLYAKWKSTLIYQYEVTGIYHLQVGVYVVLYWINPTDSEFSHVRIIPAGFEWAESSGMMDQEPGITSYSVMDYANTEYIIIKSVNKAGYASEGIKYLLK